MKKLLAACFVMISLVSFSQSERVKEIHSRIDEHRHNLPLKISLYSQILKTVPNDYEALLGQGEAYYSRWKILGRINGVYLDSALIQMNKACLSNKADYRAFNARGNFNFDFKQWDKAFSDFTKVIELNHELLHVRWKRALIHMEWREYHKALDDLNYVLKREAPSGWLLRIRAGCYAHLLQYGKCKRDIMKAVSIDDTDNDNYILLGDCYALTGDYKKAIKEYSYVINRNNLYSLAFIKRGNAYAAMGQADKAYQDWEVAKKRGYVLDDDLKKIIFGIKGQQAF